MTTDLTPITPDILDLIAQAIDAHADESRTATVTVRIAVKIDKESGASAIVAKMQASLPVGESDGKTIKLRPVTLAKFGGDHPGQMRIEQ